MHAMVKQLYSLLLFLLLPTVQLWATHIRAGEIIARRISTTSLTYEILLRGYTDLGSQVIFGSNGTLVFGDGRVETLTNQDCDEPFTCENLNNQTRFYEARFVHTYPGPGSYVVSFIESYRNEGVQNITNSVNTNFYIETLLVINPFVGVNNTPELFAPPIEEAAVGELYIHNPAAFDPDGDSLSYRIVPNKEARGVTANGYRFPNETFPPGDTRNGNSLPKFPGGPLGDPEFYINPVVGDLIWDTPGYGGEIEGQAAEYNAAFIVEEWRKIGGEYVRLGYVTRDMQIIVHNTDNSPPDIEPIEEICVVAGELIEFDLRITDPENQDVFVELLSGAEIRGANLDIDSTIVSTNPAATGKFSWQTDCRDIRSQPWLLTFRATDQGNVAQLSDVETVIVRIVGPKPQIVDPIVVDEDRTATIQFDADNYLPCLQELNGEKDAAKFTKKINLQLWRRVGEGPPIVADTCNPGMPPEANYQLIGTLPTDQFPFIDQGLEPGLTYCYALVAEFPTPEGGLSLVGDPVCVSLEAVAPLMTKVSILETGVTDGQIQIEWIKPPEPKGLEPFTYELKRGEGFSASNYTSLGIFTDDDLDGKIEFTDGLNVGLNTQDLAYSYKVILRDANNLVLDSSAVASTVRLGLVPQADAIQLNWQAQVPWNNQAQSYPIHRVYRNNTNPTDNTEFNLIAEVDVNAGGFRYTDSGFNGEELDPDILYSYLVETQGSYETTETAFVDPLTNFSQIASSFTSDTLAPCPPFNLAIEGFSNCEEYIANTECASKPEDFFNTLSWETSGDIACGIDLAKFIILSSRDGINFNEIAEVNGSIREFTDDLRNEMTFARYYRIVAVDQSGNRSEASAIIQRDNCPNYWIPNVVITASVNGNSEVRPPRISDTDGTNGNYAISQQVFRERCPRFVEQVIFTVYNRWGKEVYFYDSNNARTAQGEIIPVSEAIYINWDGRTSEGKRLSAGTYYYSLEVMYNVLDPEKQAESRSGWIDFYETNP